MAKATIPHIPKLSADGRAQVAEGCCGLLACCAQGLRGLFISVAKTQNIISHLFDNQHVKGGTCSSGYSSSKRTAVKSYIKIGLKLVRVKTLC